MDDETKRRARVLSVVALGRDLAEASHPLGHELREALIRAGTLSARGVELAIGEYLETHTAEADLTALLASVRHSGHCHVILSANVCTGALRAIALAAASAPEISVKASRRDPTLAHILVRELAKSPSFLEAGGTIREVDKLTPGWGDLVHAYGSDDTLTTISRALPTGVAFVGHGTGFGVAVVGASDASEDAVTAAADAIARDVVVFDQRGCLSPRLVLVEGREAAHRFALELDRALREETHRVPPGPEDPHDKTDVARYVELMKSIGEVFIGSGHVVGLDDEPEALWIGPAARVVHVAAVDAPKVAALLGPVAAQVTTLGSSGEGVLFDAVVAACPLARHSKLGAMQRPPLDGPVDRRT